MNIYMYMLLLNDWENNFSTGFGKTLMLICHGISFIVIQEDMRYIWLYVTWYFQNVLFVPCCWSRSW